MPNFTIGQQESVQISTGKYLAVRGTESSALHNFLWLIFIFIILGVGVTVWRAATRCEKRRASPPASRETSPQKPVLFGKPQYRTIILPSGQPASIPNYE